jgi:hypothetical protein
MQSLFPIQTAQIEPQPFLSASSQQNVSDQTLGSAQKRFLRAQVCRACGYFHDGQGPDLCEHCQTPLQTGQAETLVHLFEMTTGATRRVERITCEEEERIRQGYVVTSHYRFASDAHVAQALERIAARTGMCKVFGSYPRWRGEAG